MAKKRPITADDLLKIQYLGDPQISPDGRLVMFSMKQVGKKNNYVTNLFSVDEGGSVTQWTQGEGGAGMGRFSPDGLSIAFVGGRDKPGAQIYVISTQGGEARKLTDLEEGSVGEIRWSPDGKKIAYTFRPSHPEWTEKARKQREEKGLSIPPRMMDNAWYRLDGDGYFLSQRHAIFILDVATGKSKKLYDGGELGSYSFDWSPDSKSLAVAHSAEKNPLYKPDNDQIYIVGMDGKTRKLPGLPKGTKGSVRWSPDGKWIAYAGDDSEDDPWGVKNSKLFIVSPKGGEPTCLTRKTDYCLAASTLSDTKEAGFDAIVEWAPDSQAVYVQIGWHGGQQLGMAPIAKGGVELLTKGKHAVTVGNVSRDGSKVACLWGDALHLNEAAIYDFESHADAPRVVTNFNKGFHAAIELCEPKEFWVESTAKAKVQGWVMRPTGASKKPRAAVLEVHGGPHAQYGWTFFHEFQLLAANGYVVVYSNPRGSKGYGEKFCDAIRSDWGNKDWDDVKAVTKHMAGLSGVDPKRIGIMGGSYGGYMTNWAVGHSKAYKAAITDRCVSNLVSMAGSSDFPINKNSYFKGIAYGDLKDIEPLWKQSPLAYFKNVKTPMLIIHSEGDLRCNVEQGEQVFSALQAEGVPSRFVRYPQTTFHGMSRNGPPDLRLHRLGEILSWWATYL